MGRRPCVGGCWGRWGVAAARRPGWRWRGVGRGPGPAGGNRASSHLCSGCPGKGLLFLGGRSVVLAGGTSRPHP